MDKKELNKRILIEDVIKNAKFSNEKLSAELGEKRAKENEFIQRVVERLASK